jgi:hypothetical protein
VRHWVTLEQQVIHTRNKKKNEALSRINSR